MGLKIFYFLPQKIKFRRFRRKELDKNILDKYRNIYGSVFIAAQNLLLIQEKRKFEFDRCCNKLCPVYRKFLVWKNILFDNIKILKFILLNVI